MSKKKNSLKWLSLINIPFQMGVIIFAGVFFGNYLDDKTGFSPLFVVSISLISIGIALYNVYKQVKAIQDKNDD
ncbi:AtpZ/AtpI family protein [Flavobacterium sp.]|jgi:F0F1-type ATP synthase assembly protein I|uniref:AtpZ/AtpI family protein n=1 Tax=Flavobacterium sp. TaxID=239 RepID=UPI002A805500|nr:AtpZ/AtpI family protein [Flavobacterium sp.]